MKSQLLALLSTFLLSLLSCTPSSQIVWEKVDEGLFLAEVSAGQKSIVGDGKITILKINPAHYNFHLLSAKRKNENVKTAEQWAKQKDMLAVVNAGMYRDDFQTNMGFMQDYNFVNNKELNKDNTIVAFNRNNDTLPEVQIIDCVCQDWDVLKYQYQSFTQSIRMVDCNQVNKWSQQERIWSMVIFAMDKQENVLFIFTRSPHSVHDFVEMLLDLPLDIYNAMYLEGGPEASIYLDHNNKKIAKFGSYETGFNENDDNNRFWQIPNMIGITKK